MDQCCAIVNECPTTSIVRGLSARSRGRSAWMAGSASISVAIAAPSRMWRRFSSRFHITRAWSCHAAGSTANGDAHTRGATVLPRARRILVAPGHPELAEVHGQPERGVRAPGLLEDVPVALVLQRDLEEVGDGAGTPRRHAARGPQVVREHLDRRRRRGPRAAREERLDLGLERGLPAFGVGRERLRVGRQEGPVARDERLERGVVAALGGVAGRVALAAAPRDQDLVRVRAVDARLHEAGEAALPGGGGLLRRRRGRDGARDGGRDRGRRGRRRRRLREAGRGEEQEQEIGTEAHGGRIRELRDRAPPPP
ncbi:MAG: hypothetical protein QM820_39325 [Minicystis sp.]